MPIVLGVILIVLAAIILFWVTSAIVGVLLMLAMAGVVGWLADMVVPGRLPYGWLGAIVAGLLGTILGSVLPVVNHLGPSLFGIRPIPAFVGAVIVIAIAGVVGVLTPEKKRRDLPTTWREP